MSWSGTVYCGYCGKKGHNRAGCTKRKQEIREFPDGYEAQKAARKKAYTSPRQCGYCNKSGHNKRTCPEITFDRAKTKKANRLWRESFFNVADEIGFGKGALLELRDPALIERDWERGEIERYIERFGKLAVVVGFNPDKLNHKRGEENTYSSSYETKLVMVLFPNGKKLEVELPGEFARICDGGSHGVHNKHWQVVHGVDGNIRKSFTASFKDGSYGVDKLLGLN